jgi:hypothetical protein
MPDVINSLAYGVYSYTAAATGTGEVGRADFNVSATTLKHFIGGVNVSQDGNIDDLTPDPKVFWFEHSDGTGRLLVAQTYYDADYVPQPSEFSVYNADTLEQIWPGAGSVPWDVGLVNVYNIVTATVGDYQYIYGIDHDSARVFRVRIGVNSKGKETYAFDSSASYKYTSTEAFNYGVDIAIYGSDIYALFVRSEGQYGETYNTSAIVRLELDLTSATVNEKIAKNAVNMKFWTDTSSSDIWIYIPAIGGPQDDAGGYNVDSFIQRITAGFNANTTPTILLVNDTGGGVDPDDPDKTNYYDISFKEGSSNGQIKAFVLKGVYGSSSTFQWYLFGTSLATIDSARSSKITDIVTSSAAQKTDSFTNGFVWALPYDVPNDMTWFVRGNEIAVYNYAQGLLYQFVPPAPATGGLGVGDPTGTEDWTDYLAGSTYNINGAAAYGVEGTLKGAASPSTASVAARAASAAAAEEEK